MIPPSSGQSNAGAPHGCVWCRKLFPTRTALEEHVNSPDHPYKCELCKTHHAEIAAFRDHLELSHSGYMCTFGSCPYWSSEKLDVEQHFLTHQEVPEHASDAVRARKFGSPEGLGIGKRKTVVEEQGEDGLSVAPGEKRPAKMAAATATAASASTVGHTFVPRLVVCPFRLNQTYGNEGSVSCRTLYDGISPLIKHLQSVHGLEVTDSSLSSFSFRRFIDPSARVAPWDQPVRKSGVCQACWKIFRTAEELSAHVAHPCKPRSLSNFDKHNVLYDAFARKEDRVEKPSVAVPAVNEAEALPTTRTLSSSPYTPLNLPLREETSSGDFTCFDETQPTLHDLQYYEEDHSNTGQPKANSSDLTGEPSTPWQGVFGSVQASNESAGGTSIAPSRDTGVTLLSQREPQSWFPLFPGVGDEQLRVDSDERLPRHETRTTSGGLVPTDESSLSVENTDPSGDFLLFPTPAGVYEPQFALPELDPEVSFLTQESPSTHVLYDDDILGDNELDGSGKGRARPSPQAQSDTTTPDTPDQYAVSPGNALFAERLQAANNKHLNVVPPVPPSSRTASQYKSAFRYGSPLAPPPKRESSRTIPPLDSLTASPLAPPPKHEPSSTIPPLGHFTGTTTQTSAAAQPALRPLSQTDPSEPNLEASFAPGASPEAGVKARNDHQPGQSVDEQQDLLQIGSSTLLNDLPEDEFRRASDMSLMDETQHGAYMVDDVIDRAFLNLRFKIQCRDCEHEWEDTAKTRHQCPRCASQDTEVVPILPQTWGSDEDDLIKVSDVTYALPTQDSVTQGAPYKCDQCNLTFDDAHMLNHHKRYHERPHICEHTGCDKRFGTKIHLDRHVNREHGKLGGYFCSEPRCPYSIQKSFPRRDIWLRHMRAKHNIANPEPLWKDVLWPTEGSTQRPSEVLPDQETRAYLPSTIPEPRRPEGHSQDAELERLRAENQRLRDDISSLKILPPVDSLSVPFDTALPSIRQMLPGLLDREGGERAKLDTGADSSISVDAGDTEDAPLSLKAQYDTNSAVPPAAILAHPEPHDAAYRFNSDLISETDAGSDSGYGHPPTRAQESSILGDSQPRHPPVGFYPVPAQTDSGYASLPHGEAKQLQQASEHVADSALRQMPVTEEEEANDVGTIYSDDRSQASVSKTQRYISEFVDHLFGKIKLQMEDGNVDRLVDCLPDLLQAFALKIGQSSATRGHYEVMYFVYKHRRAIAQSLQDRVNQDEAHGSSEVADSCTDPTGMSIDDKLSLWARMESTAEPERQFEAEDFPEIEPLEDELDLNELYRYQSLIMDSPAFDWLVGSLKRELHLANSATVGMIDIRKRILQGLPTPRRVSRKQAVPSVQVIFRVSWDPLSFIEAQGYDKDTDDILSKIITLTGSSVDVQAATCKQYLCQTWPSTGEHMLRIMEGTIRESTGAETPKRRTYILPDNTRITATHVNQALTLDASGTAYSMVEIGEQLGWLVTALRSSPRESMISVFYPTVTWFRRDALSSEPLSCYIGMTSAGYLGDNQGPFAPLTATQRNGDCWPRMFRNPVVVGGYPIPRRQDLENGSGVEIPLDMLVALTDATGVSEFDGKIFIKGYSAMLIPTKQVDGIILWHLLFNEDGGRIPYTDCRIAALDHINPTGIKQARHILGWVSHARNNTGSPKANYDIKWSGLGKPRERHAWEKVIISGGDSVGVSASFVIGKKDKGILAGGLGGYASRLKFISKQYVVLYDLDDRRAWLVDGLSALLHMVRASLEHDQKDVLNPFYLYSRGQVKESAPTLHGPEAAAAVLFNPQNCSLRLYTESEDTWDEETETHANGIQGTAAVREVVSRRRVTYYCLKDRVLEIFSLLEKMIDHLNNVQAETGVGFRLRGTPRNILEGFDFMDVATSNAPIRPHMIKLNICESGRGWTDLLRSIQAITLFGKGFGELISPSIHDISSPACGGCGYSTSMPTGKDYLATCVSLVERILTTRGSTETVPWCLADDIYWHTPGPLFDPCHCASNTTTRKPYGRVQVLLPSTFPKLWGRGFASPQRLESLGAVMFSHNWRFPFRLGNDTNQETKMLEPNDSGLGTSVDSSSTRSQLSGITDDTETQASNAGDGSSVRSPGAPTAVESVVGTVDLPLRTDTRTSKKRKLVDVVDRLKRKVMKPSSDVELESFANERAVGGGG